MHFLLALVFVLAWDPVTRDCRGGLEAGPIRYDVLIFEARVTGTTIDGFGNIVPVYAKVAQHQTTVQTSMTVIAPEPPAVDEVTLVDDPEAVDASDNGSNDPCP